MKNYVQEISESSLALVLYVDSSMSLDDHEKFKGLSNFSHQINKPILILQDHQLNELNQGDLEKFGLKLIDPKQFECPCAECTSQD